MDNTFDEFLADSNKMFIVYLGMASEIELAGTVSDVWTLGAVTESYLESLEQYCGNCLSRAADDSERTQILQYTRILRNDYQAILLKMLQARPSFIIRNESA